MLKYFGRDWCELVENKEARWILVEELTANTICICGHIWNIVRQHDQVYLVQFNDTRAVLHHFAQNSESFGWSIRVI